jgi:hypothetical protein
MKQIPKLIILHVRVYNIHNILDNSIIRKIAVTNCIIAAYSYHPLKHKLAALKFLLNMPANYPIDHKNKEEEEEEEKEEEEEETNIFQNNVYNNNFGYNLPRTTFIKPMRNAK